jgi:hypothetical protein
MPIVTHVEYQIAKNTNTLQEFYKKWEKLNKLTPAETNLPRCWEGR